MIFPIQHALLHPLRLPPVEPALDLRQPFSLDFEPLDHARFPLLRLAIEALRSGGTAPAAYNAANEIAVDAFLRNQIGFLDIPAIIEASLNDTQHRDPKNIEEVLSADSEARRLAMEKLRD